MSTRYRLDSRPPGGRWDEGTTYPTGTLARARMDALERSLPTWDFRLVRIRERVIDARLAPRKDLTTEERAWSEA